MTSRITLLAAIVLVGGLYACGGADGEPGTDASASETSPADRPAPAAAAPQGPVDPQLAARGEELFAAKACVGCHTVGKGRLTGPDLAGVTERRTREWILAMITNPDSMLKTDATARQLFMEYATPMANMNVSRDEALALHAYLRSAGDAQ